MNLFCDDFVKKPPFLSFERRGLNIDETAFGRSPFWHLNINLVHVKSNSESKSSKPIVLHSALEPAVLDLRTFFRHFFWMFFITLTLPFGRAPRRRMAYCKRDWKREKYSVLLTEKGKIFLCLAIVKFEKERDLIRCFI